MKRQNHNKFVTEVHRDLLRLAEYHKKSIVDKNNRGIKDADDAERLRLLNEIPRLVRDNIGGRETHYLNAKKEADNLRSQRELADCPQCSVQRKVKIIKATINEKFGWKLDVVKCRVCKTEFTNYFPNNWHDRLKYLEHFHSKLYEVNEEGKTMAEIMEEDGVIDSKSAYKNFDAFRKAQLKVEESEKKSAEALELAYQSLVAFRDSLLMAKLKDENWNLSTNPPLA